MKRTLYLDCFSGICGDMFFAALIDLGLRPEAVCQELEKLNFDGYKIVIKKVKEKSISGVDVEVILDQDKHQHEQQDQHKHKSQQQDQHENENQHKHLENKDVHMHGHGHDTSDHMHGHDHDDSDHMHDHGHDTSDHMHGHDHDDSDHIHGHTDDDSNHTHTHTHEERNLFDIFSLIMESGISNRAKRISVAVFTEIAKAEATVHGENLEDIHFHEVGAIDSIIDIVGVAICLDMLNVEKICASPLHDGSGFIECRHGIIPVPVPAVMAMLKDSNIPVVIEDVQTEMVTPTGAGIVKTLSSGFGPMPPMTIEKVGYGFGKRRLPNRFNGMRIVLGYEYDLKTKDRESLDDPWDQHKRDIAGMTEMKKMDTDIADMAGMKKMAYEHNREDTMAKSDTEPKLKLEAKLDPKLEAKLEPKLISKEDRIRLRQYRTVLESSELKKRNTTSDIKKDSVYVLETNIDDMTGENLGYVMEKVLETGALDVYFTPIQMKKNRPAVMLSIICSGNRLSTISDLLMKETTTLGIRVRETDRFILARDIKPFNTPFGIVKKKTARVSSAFNMSGEKESDQKVGFGSDKKVGFEPGKKVGFGSEQKVGFGTDKKVGFGTDKKVGFEPGKKVGFGAEQKVGFGSDKKTGFEFDQKGGFKSDKKVSFEYDDCAKIARETGLPLKDVYNLLLAEYMCTNEKK